MAISWSATAAPAIQHVNFGSSSATFSTVAIGTASADRIVVVFVCSNNGYPSSMTIGGSAATLVARSNATADPSTAIFYLAVSSGTTADVVATGSTVMQLCGIHVGILKGSASTEDNSAVEPYAFTGNPHTLDSDPTVPSGGRGLFVVSGGGVDTMSTTSATEDNQTVTTDGNGLSIMSGHETSSGSWDFDWTGSNFSGSSGVGLGWGPAATGNPKGPLNMPIEGPLGRVVV